MRTVDPIGQSGIGTSAVLGINARSGPTARWKSLRAEATSARLTKAIESGAEPPLPPLETALDEGRLSSLAQMIREPRSGASRDPLMSRKSLSEVRAMVSVLCARDACPARGSCHGR